MIYTFDCEVFKHDWLIVFKEITTGEYTVIWNDNYAVKKFMTQDKLLAGFNSKHYDNHILKAILCGANNSLVKEINDYIISGKQGFEHPFVKKNSAWFDSFDIKDDMQMGLSLKAIEGHLGMNVEETTVPFDIDRPLTPEERLETEKYCKHDVDTAEHLIKLRKPYLDGKIALGRMKDIPDSRSLYSTNAKITAMFLSAEPKKHSDERAYVYPENLNKELIPKEILDFFDKIHDLTIPDEKLFKSKLQITVGDCEFIYGWGGVHGAIPNYQEEDTEKRIIVNQDVASLYPSLMILCGYTSRNIPSADFYKQVYNDRLKAKKEGDKKTANTLKLCLNTTYGAMLNKYNPLYDPLMGRSVCVSGQLYLTELAISLIGKCRTLRVINFNTDGIMYSIDKQELEITKSIAKEWQQRTGFVLEDDYIKKVIQKDVNNYIIVNSDGSVKKKGGYLTYGIQAAGSAWNINNNFPIVKKAICDYFVNGTPVEQTIGGCNDILEFQMIAKAGVKYKEAFHLVDGERVPVQKVNRVYATSDERYGTLTKVKISEDDTERKQKIESLPEHCIIDNDNHLTINDIDKSFYIQVAKKRIDDFLGIKQEKIKKVRKQIMATTKKDTNPTLPNEDIASMNVHQKLMHARVMFLKADVKKTGLNRFAEFKYFELADISPVATNIFAELGLLFVTSFENGEAIGILYNCNNPEQFIIVKSPMRELTTVSQTGKNKMNELQGLGAEETYQRRYLYMAILDITENDTFDAGTDGDDAPEAKSEKTSSPPATQEERTELKATLTDKNGKATKVQIEALKNALKMLRSADPEQEDFIKEVYVRTDELTNISKVACEELIVKIGELIDVVEDKK